MFVLIVLVKSSPTYDYLGVFWKMELYRAYTYNKKNYRRNFLIWRGNELERQNCSFHTYKELSFLRIIKFLLWESTRIF